MKSKNIRIIIFLAVFAVVGILVNQFFWIKNSLEIQENTLEIQKENGAIEREQFDNQVTLALVDVRDQLISLNTEASGLYLEPVQQITTNYFVVSFYDTLNPDLLENILIDKFNQFNIDESFEYGIYDCFADSIIFDSYVNLSQGEVISTTSTTPVPQQKWNHDGHYFGVYFPERQEFEVGKKDDLSIEFIWSTLLITSVMIIFLITISTILRQKKLSEVKTDFINNMTHELKTPISTIALSSEVLKEDKIDPDRIKRYAHIISAENARLESQVERVLQLAKLDKGQAKLKRERFDLHQLIINSSETFRIFVEQENGHLNFDLKADDTILFADKVHITNVLYNLLDNAIKYCDKVPEITISTVAKQKGIEVCITDNGKGISKNQIKQIFDKFYRIPTGSLHDVKGFGLGLYYVAKIIKAHKGKVGVYSELGMGSKFSVWLPST